MSSSERQPPPKLGPEERLAPGALGKLAQALLSEMARNDPVLADRMRRLGIAPHWGDQPKFAQGGASATGVGRKRPGPALPVAERTATACRNRPP